MTHTRQGLKEWFSRRCCGNPKMPGTLTYLANMLRLAMTG
jgi:hypothetical protein